MEVELLRCTVNTRKIWAVIGKNYRGTQFYSGKTTVCGNGTDAVKKSISQNRTVHGKDNTQITSTAVAQRTLPTEESVTVPAILKFPGTFGTDRRPCG